MSTTTGVESCRRSIAHHSKSFSLAARLLPGRTADEAAILYAWCRRADDAVDHAPPGTGPAALERLRAELADVYAGRALEDPELREFQAVVAERRIHPSYPEELLNGMEMDCRGERYETMDDLLAYCFRVAGVVGLMMCPVLGVRDRRALRRAAHLGIAMQITNICRDVLEDWEMGRLYVPAQLLAECGAPGLAGRLGGPFPDEARAPMAAAVQRLLQEAEGYYASGDRGLPALPWQAAFAVGVARRVYAAIGRRIRRQGCDVTAGRAVVSTAGKLLQVARAAGGSLAQVPARLGARRPQRDTVVGVVRFPEDVLPL